MFRKSIRHFLKKFFRYLANNHQGQVAIFVALIFQVIFILFALLINVGLLVHHKINLQQSTDLAAYYGAMKQAEILNVVGHVNFQIRQAWKLLTWRYRVLGTFGLRNSKGNPPDGHVRLPIERLFDGTGQSRYNPDSNDIKCPFPNNVSANDVPFMCFGHSGFQDWNVAGAGAGSANEITRNESFCAVDCGHVRHSATQIQSLSTIPTGGVDSGTTSTIGIVNEALNQANANLRKACNTVGPQGVILFSKFYQSYLQDVKNRKEFIKMLLMNLSAAEDVQVDLDGGSIRDGVIATLRNNLTATNNISIENERDIFLTNSLNGNNCAYRYENQKNTSSNNLVSEINFQYIQYFILTCQETRTAGADVIFNFSVSSIYDQNTLNLNQNVRNQLQASQGADAVDDIQSIIGQNNFHHTIGFEKNLWCPIYYGVRATSKPVIPFLPLETITLNAVSFAKPFGSSIGPWYGKSWPAGSRSSLSAPKVDENLPIRSFDDGTPETLVDASKNLFLNYSNYVGDNLGLRDGRFLASYHDMLINKVVGNYNIFNNHSVSTSKNREELPFAGNWTNPRVWPSFSEWNNISADLINDSRYDPLAYNTLESKNSFLRDIELSVVAPNQFEATYYSIEPDFYNVYLKRLEKSKSTLTSITGIPTNIELPYDFGHNKHRVINGIPETFAVRNQLEVVQKVIRGRNDANDKAPAFSMNESGYHSRNLNLLFSDYFRHIPSKPTSLLTSWTLKDLTSDDYSIVPLADSDSLTPFAACRDPKGSGQDYESLSTDDLPPTSGNCVSGGRTGYSVKIVNEGALIGNDQGEFLNQPRSMGFLD